MLITCYLASAAIFYLFSAKCAPMVERPVHSTCEIIEIFPNADHVASRAA